MTKQEAINLITKTIYDNSMRSSYMETMPVATKVLDALIMAGMLPPVATFTMSNGDPISKAQWETATEDKILNHWRQG